MYFRWLPCLLLVLIASPSCAGSGTADTCLFRVGRSRPPRPNQLPYEEQNPLLRDPQSRTVPGPRGLSANVVSDSLHHPHIYLEDTATKARRHLMAGSGPRWSPDGRYIACSVWESRDRPWMLRIVEVKTGRVLSPTLACFAMNYRWSPSGRFLAVEGPLIGSSTGRGLCRVAIPSLASAILDSMPVASNYHVSWSPNSRFLVTDRATRLDHYGDVTASDLLLIDERLHKCRLTRTPDMIESEPRWIDATHIRYTLERIRGEDGDEESRVLELVPARSTGAIPGGPS